MMSNKEIQEFFKEYKNINADIEEKQRILNLFQVKDNKGCLHAMSYNKFKKTMTNKRGRIIKLVRGPKWSPLVFVDINVEV